MEEDLVRLVMSKYWESKGIRAVSSNPRAAGPDFHIDGTAVEVKGTNSDFPYMLKQLIDYARKSKGVQLALPFDALTLERANQLYALHLMIKATRKIRLVVYLVAPHPSQANSYYVREVEEPSLIPGWMNAPSPMSFGFDYEKADSTLDKAVENLIKWSPVEQLRGQVCSTVLPWETSQVHI
jgi:hypothetical protein